MPLSVQHNLLEVGGKMWFWASLKDATTSRYSVMESKTSVYFLHLTSKSAATSNSVITLGHVYEYEAMYWVHRVQSMRQKFYKIRRWELKCHVSFDITSEQLTFAFFKLVKNQSLFSYHFWLPYFVWVGFLCIVGWGFFCLIWNEEGKSSSFLKTRLSPYNQRYWFHCKILMFPP